MRCSVENIYAPVVVVSFVALAVLVGFVVRELRKSNEILMEILHNTSIRSREALPEKKLVSRPKMAG
jgi:hypothetical protein